MQRVGRLKANWLGPNEYWAKLAHGPAIRGVKWVRARSFAPEYSHTGRLGQTGGHIESTNRTPYIQNRNTPEDKLEAAKRITMAGLYRHSVHRIDRLREQFGRA